MSSFEKESQKNQEKNPKSNIYTKYMILFSFILISSIILPLLLIILNQSSSCAHHIKKLGGNLWIAGRALGFTTFILLIYSGIIGIKTKRIAQAMGSYPKAKNYHCFVAFSTNFILLIHVLLLLVSEPWGDLIFEGEANHIPFSLFMVKLWTGIIFGIIMVLASLLFYYLKDVKRLKKFGYKRFIRVHHLMLFFTFFLAIHIFLNNTEIIILTWG